MLLRLMAESDPIKRMKAAARRAAGPVNVDTQHRWYMEELEETIGRDPSGTWQQRDVAPTDRGLLGMIILVVLLVVMTFTATLAVLLWRDGAFDGWLGTQSVHPASKSPRWVLGDEETGRPSAVPTGKPAKSDAPPNEIEPLLHPAPPPVADEPEADASAAE